MEIDIKMFDLYKFSSSVEMSTNQPHQVSTIQWTRSDLRFTSADFLPLW